MTVSSFVLTQRAHTLVAALKDLLLQMMGGTVLVMIDIGNQWQPCMHVYQ